MNTLDALLYRLWPALCAILFHAACGAASIVLCLTAVLFCLGSSDPQALVVEIAGEHRAKNYAAGLAGLAFGAGVAGSGAHIAGFVIVALSMIVLEFNAR